jgi:hypothetical protein
VVLAPASVVLTPASVVLAPASVALRASVAPLPLPTETTTCLAVVIVVIADMAKVNLLPMVKLIMVNLRARLNKAAHSPISKDLLHLVTFHLVKVATVNHLRWATCLQTKATTVSLLRWATCHPTKATTVNLLRWATCLQTKATTVNLRAHLNKVLYRPSKVKCHTEVVDNCHLTKEDMAHPSHHSQIKAHSPISKDLLHPIKATTVSLLRWATCLQTKATTVNLRAHLNKVLYRPSKVKCRTEVVDNCHPTKADMARPCRHSQIKALYRPSKVKCHTEVVDNCHPTKAGIAHRISRVDVNGMWRAVSALYA